MLENDRIKGAIGEFGLVKTNPIPIKNEEEGMEYLSRLKPIGIDGPVALEYFGCVSVAEINERVQCYEMFDVSNGRNICDLYLVGDAERTIWEAPKGFVLKELDEA